MPKVDLWLTFLQFILHTKHSVTRSLIPHFQPGNLHISCSTVSPFTSRELAALHAERQVGFVGAPVFARPDGVARKQAYFTLGATDAAAIERARWVALWLP